MSKYKIEPTGKERTFKDDEVIVSKTDPKGIITYVNQVFVDVAIFTEQELLGKPHSIIRHPEMPRCVFKLLWDTVESGKEIFAYVVNMCKNGDHYWVLAHVTPSFDSRGRITGYHSNRRVPDKAAVDKISAIYDLLLKEEAKHSDRKKGMEAGFALLVNYLKENNTTYEEFVFSL